MLVIAYMIYFRLTALHSCSCVTRISRSALSSLLTPRSSLRAAKSLFRNDLRSGVIILGAKVG